MDILAGVIVKMLFRAAIGSLIGAVFVRAAASWVAKQDVEYLKAYGLYFLNQVMIGLIVLVTGFVCGLGSDLLGLDVGDVELFTILAVVGLLIGLPTVSGVFCVGLSLSYGRAMLVALITYGLAFAIFGGIALFAWIVLS